MNVIGSWHLVEDMFTQIAKFLSTEERLICMRVCRVWNRLLDTTLIWQMSYKRDFDNSPLTYSRSNPKEQYLEKVGIALHLHAKNREIQHLTSFQGVGRPFKPIGHLLIGCLQGNIVAKNLHNNVMYPCSGRPDVIRVNGGKLIMGDPSDNRRGQFSIFSDPIHHAPHQSWNIFSFWWHIDNSPCSPITNHILTISIISRFDFRFTISHDERMQCLYHFFGHSRASSSPLFHLG